MKKSTKYNICDNVLYHGKLKVVKSVMPWDDSVGEAIYLVTLPNGQSPLVLEESQLDPYIPQTEMQSQATSNMNTGELNLCELLEGHEGETFYSPICGEIKFIGIDFTKIHPIRTNRFYLNNNGKWNDDGEVMIFPSKGQRDWNKWAEEQKPKVPKTWNELVKQGQSKLLGIATIGDMYINVTIAAGNKRETFKETLIEKSALALLKIHQLIEVGYGGNITKEEWDDDNIIKYTIKSCCNDIVSCSTDEIFSHIAFHTERQRDEFLSYPENLQLVKDFYMI